MTSKSKAAPKTVLGVVSSLLALVLLSGQSTAAVWFASTAVAGGNLASDSVDLTTPSAADLGRLADWSNTTVQLTATPSGATSYGTVSAPAPVLKNTGAREVFIEVGSVQFAPVDGAETSDAQAQALAGAIKVSWSTVTGNACTSATFAAGSSLQVLSPVSGAPANAVQPVNSNGASAARTLAVNAQKTLCAKYEIVAPAAVPAAAWGRAIVVTYRWLGVEMTSGSWTSTPVVWKQKLQLNVPAPILSCTATNGVPTVSWTWPTAAGGADPTSFDVQINSLFSATTKVVAGAGRTLTINTGLLGTIFGANYTVTITADVAAQSSPVSNAVSVRFNTGGRGSC